MAGVWKNFAVGFLVRHYRAVLGCLSLSVFLAFAGACLLRPVYSATALLLLEPGASESTDTARLLAELELLRQPVVYARAAAQIGLLDRDDLSIALRLRDEALAFFHVPRVADGMASVEETAREITRSVTAERLGLAPIIAVTARAGCPDVAAAIANAVAGAHLGLQQEARSAGALRLAAPALPPAERYGPAAMETALWGLGAGSLLVLFGLVFAAGPLGSVRSKQALARIVGAPFTLGLPQLAKRCSEGASHADALAETPDSPFCEGILALRMTLSRSLATEKASPVIAVTSAQVGEGKTTTALALARALDRAGQRVLLIDANGGSGGLRRCLDVPSAGQKWAEVDEGTFLAATHRDPISRVSVLLDLERPSASGGRRRLASVLRAARFSFDVVVLDMPPASRSADLAELMPQVSAAVLLARWGRTEPENLAEAAHAIRAAQSGVIPIIPVLAQMPTAIQRRVRRQRPAYVTE
ncbi:AAA family ATPase [Devosia crocina]|nr:AAA family ATPase [Devosia crocina]